MDNGHSYYRNSLHDSLSETNRKERRALLGLSVLGIAITEAQLIPSEISISGIKIEHVDGRILVVLYGLILVYFVITFATYAWADFITWKMDLTYHDVTEDLQANSSGGTQQDQVNQYVIQSATRLHFRQASRARATVDYLLPVAAGIIALGFVVKYLLRH
jgi:hypothetical protein